jgi:NitT/TauT family transport system permease protein
MRKIDWAWNFIFILILFAAMYILVSFIKQQLKISEVFLVLKLGCYTALRVIATIIFCTLVWVPIGVWIGLRPKYAAVIQPIAQFFAAFPANLLFPIVVVVIVRWHLNVNIWTTPLMILGTQWYVLFNVVAGAAAIPKDLKQVIENFGVRGWLWWRRLILPGIFPYYITGAITAVGGAWNASLVAEVVTWGKTTLEAKGLGAYVTHNTGDFSHTVLGVSVMCLLVFSLNHIVWRPLYRVAVRRYQIE